MAFSSLERSTFSGRPLQLYQFLRTSNGVDHYWRYNGADRDLTYLGNVYTAVSISDEGVRLTGEAASSEFQITLPALRSSATTTAPPAPRPATRSTRMYSGRTLTTSAGSTPTCL
jgi:hypothetical protein